MLSFTWPGEIPDLDGFPVLSVTVTTPRDQAALHRHLARLGYVPELLSEGGTETWRFHHPDGELP